MMFLQSPFAHRRLKKLASTGLMSHAEYSRIYRTICARGPCRLLIFGRGHDSTMWTKANRRGITVFLESDAQWNTPISGAKSYLVDYETTLDQYEKLLLRHQTGDHSALALTLPPQVESASWDIVLVDGPAGYAPSMPGRMKAIHTARRLASSSYDVFIHDIDRIVERAYADYFFGTDYETVGTLRHYAVRQPARLSLRHSMLRRFAGPGIPTRDEYADQGFRKAG